MKRLLAGALSIALATGGLGLAAPAQATSPLANSTWYPTGFKLITTEVAGRFVRGAKDPCGYGPKCWYWTLDVFAKNGCPGGLFVSANLLDRGTVVDDTIDSASCSSSGRCERLM